MRPSRLDDPEHATHAWGRFGDILAWMVVAAGLATIAGLLAIAWLAGPMPWHLALAAALGIFFTVWLTAALMGLVFLSSGTGHDETIFDPFEGDDDVDRG